MPGAGAFVLLVALLMARAALSIDAMLPALPDICRDRAAAQHNDAQLVVTALPLGLGSGQRLFGRLSDCVGRKPAICAGLALFMAGWVLSIPARTFEAMLAGRVLPGAGVAAPRGAGPPWRGIETGTPDGAPDPCR